MKKNMQWTCLKKLWERSVKPVNAGVSGNDSWNEEVEALYSLGIGMEKTLRYLYQEKPDLYTFKTWIEGQSRIETKQPDLIVGDVLTEDELASWDEHGFVVVKNAISRAEAEATQHAILEFLGMDPDDRDTWYQQHEEQRGMMVTLTDHPCLDRNRQSPAIKKAFEQLYQSTELYKSIDKVSFNPPETGRFSFKGSPLHWDVSLKQPVPFVLQGLLYLTDCGAEEGAFHCVPGFHKHIGDWLAQLAPGDNPRDIAPQRLEPVPVPGKAGDFVIWHAALPHCATPNHGNSSRMVQYLTFRPIGYREAAEWI